MNPIYIISRLLYLITIMKLNKYCKEDRQVLTPIAIMTIKYSKEKNIENEYIYL